jgi:hypothetical protein
MIVVNPSPMCKQAQAYYYDRLCDRDNKCIPPQILAHMDKCSYCETEVKRLETGLAEAQNSAAETTAQTASVAATNLRLHFAYTGLSVTCSTVKPFLPSLAIPALEVRVPTPITTHLDNCHQCANDLEAIRQLDLTEKQLHRLGQILADEPAASVMSKFCQSRESLGAQSPAKMQKLRAAVSRIADRPDSEVVTRFTFEGQTDEAAVPESDDLYADWPINVEVLDKSESVHEVSHAPARPSQAFKRFIKPTIAAAAVLLIALLVFYGPVARGVDLGRIYKSLRQVENVCLTTFEVEKLEPTQRVWVSRELNIKMSRTETACVLWHIDSGSRKSKDLNTGSIMTARPDNDILISVAETMNAPWGLLPFDDISKAPEDAAWQQVEDENIQPAVPDTEVYELVWTEKSLAGSIIHKRWRGYIDIETMLPKRIEWWEKHAEEQYKLLTVTEVAYLAKAEMNAAINDAGLQ